MITAADSISPAVATPRTCGGQKGGQRRSYGGQSVGGDECRNGDASRPRRLRRRPLFQQQKRALLLACHSVPLRRTLPALSC